jgi:hypothetical protein
MDDNGNYVPQMVLCPMHVGSFGGRKCCLERPHNYALRPRMCWDPEMEWMVVYEMLGAAATRQVPATLSHSTTRNARREAVIHGARWTDRMRNQQTFPFLTVTGRNHPRWPARASPARPQNFGFSIWKR